MIEIFDHVASNSSRQVTKAYSTSFSTAVKILSPEIQADIHNIYGFVRFADEIVDTFHDWDKETLLNKFENDFYEAMDIGISLNPIIHSFQKTIKKFDIDIELVKAFLKSMRMDLSKKTYLNQEEYEEYIYGSADVVGLMCLKVFVHGDQDKYDDLKYSAQRLGSAFQKVNFLRDIKSDAELLERSYFPGIDLKKIDTETKNRIIEEIEHDFREAYKGLIRLPGSSRFGVYTAYVYYKQLLHKLKKTESTGILEKRIRVSNPEKIGLLFKSYLDVKLNLL